ncbi:MAG TPA: glycosyltransferase family 87 protein [Blastocatellia bacterium]|nr:glycosyltransferase family 87 protein [Blastocatellia bacterium]
MKRKSLAILVISSAVLIAAAGIILTRDFGADTQGRKKHLFDFEVYYDAGQSLYQQGRTDLYSADFASGRVMDYRYPPFFLIALIPLWALPAKAAAYCWFLLSLLSIIASAIILNRIQPVYKNRIAVRAITALAVAQYFVMVVHYGNAHLLAVFLLFAALYSFLKGKLPMAALLMALSITIKLTPILILPYFALKKQWRLLWLTGLFLIAINLLPSLYFGFTKNAELLKTWYRHVVTDQEFHEMNGPINLSLKGQLRRYLSEVDYNSRVDGDVNYRSINFASLPQKTVDRIWIAIALIIYVLVLFLIWRASRQRNTNGDRPVALELGLMICLMLFVGPLTSKIYFIALLWPVFFLACLAFSSPSPGPRFIRSVLILVAAANLILPLLPGSSVQRLLLVLGADFFLNCLVMAALAQALTSTRQAFRSTDVARQIQSPSPTTTP